MTFFTRYPSRMVGALTIMCAVIAGLMIFYDCWFETRTTKAGTEPEHYEFSISRARRDGQELNYADFTDGEDFFPDGISIASTKRFIYSGLCAAIMILFSALFCFVAFTTLCFKVPRLTTVFFILSALLLFGADILYYAGLIRFVEDHTDEFAETKGRESFFFALALLLALFITVMASIYRVYLNRQDVEKYSTRDDSFPIRPQNGGRTAVSRSPLTEHLISPKPTFSGPASTSSSSMGAGASVHGPLSSVASVSSSEAFQFNRTSRPNATSGDVKEGNRRTIRSLSSAIKGGGAS